MPDLEEHQGTLTNRSNANRLLCSTRWNKVPSQEALGNFELLLDEELAAQESESTSRREGRGGGGGACSGACTHTGGAHRWK